MKLQLSTKSFCFCSIWFCGYNYVATIQVKKLKKEKKKKSKKEREEPEQEVCFLFVWKCNMNVWVLKWPKVKNYLVPNLCHEKCVAAQLI